MINYRNENMYKRLLDELIKNSIVVMTLFLISTPLIAGCADERNIKPLAEW